METTPPAELEAVEAALRESEVDPSAFLYVKRIKSLNVSLSSAQAASKSNLGVWGGQFYEQALSSITAGVKNLLSSGRQAALTRVVEALRRVNHLRKLIPILFLIHELPKAQLVQPMSRRDRSKKP